jgi:hypothetical protein
LTNIITTHPIELAVILVIMPVDLQNCRYSIYISKMMLYTNIRN